MLRLTFQHLSGHGVSKEQQLWSEGITSWDAFENQSKSQMLLFGSDNHLGAPSMLEASRRALAREDADFFAEKLSSESHYRIVQTFPAKTLFLDIETTGLSRYYDRITLIGWGMNGAYGVLIQGQDDRQLRDVLARARAIVTFNGAIFDLPFIRQEHAQLTFPRCHIDLRFLVRRIGLSGGQKEVEALIGTRREIGIAEVRGEAAPLLWHQYRRGDLDALKRLITYNQADIEGMKAILDHCIDKLIVRDLIPLNGLEAHRFSASKSRLDFSTLDTSSGIAIQPFSGRRGPAVHIRDLLPQTESASLRFVGIDLTGSEKRPSGWCVLADDTATTRRLGTDAELVEATLALKPHLVSLDSPLCLPIGRVKVEDDDPGRREFGIMRECERTLKKRGVNVYPSLIPSMQALTARGIRLATEFRRAGIPVIESYPGAAQDIMDIPRKQKGLEHLATGLEEFGLTGPFTTDREISHDELDAITSAVVAAFFWSGRFEALGNEQEDALIIPDLKVDPTPWRQRLVIGLSGPIAVGKTLVARALESQGFGYGRFSMVLKDLLDQRGVKVSREALQEIGQEINSSPGQRWLCKQLLRRLPDVGHIVIDGLRHPEDHATLVETFGPGFVHVHLDASLELRRRRYANSGQESAEFDTAIEHEVEKNVPLLATLAHVRVVNEGSSSELMDRIRQLVSDRLAGRESHAG